MEVSMVAFDLPAVTERKQSGFPRLVPDSVYPTRFDIYETENEWIFRCKMPNVQLVQVETGMKRGQVIIRGKVRPGLVAAPAPTACRPLCFFRSFSIPGEVNIEQASANFKDGMLMVRLPKAGVAGPRPAEYRKERLP
jgi:HSP20 family molecular chaperone IbpA